MKYKHRHTTARTHSRSSIVQCTQHNIVKQRVRVYGCVHLETMAKPSADPLMYHSKSSVGHLRELNLLHPPAPPPPTYLLVRCCRLHRHICACQARQLLRDYTPCCANPAEVSTEGDNDKKRLERQYRDLVQELTTQYRYRVTMGWVILHCDGIPSRR